MSNQETISILIKQINSMETMPRHWMRRNHGGYRVVSAVNNVIGLYLSGELQDFFIDRIEFELKRVQSLDGATEYIKLTKKLSLELHQYLLSKVSKTRAKILNLLVLRCKDIEKTKEFYEKLSLSFVKEQHGEGSVHYSTKIGDLVLELYPLGESNVDSNRLGFSVNNSKAILEDGEIELVSQYTFDGQIHYVVVDSDGRRVEIVEEKE